MVWRCFSGRSLATSFFSLLKKHTLFSLHLNSFKLDAPLPPSQYLPLYPSMPPNWESLPMIASCANKSNGRFTTGVPVKRIRHFLPMANLSVIFVCWVLPSLQRWLSSIIIDLNNSTLGSICISRLFFNLDLWG